MTSTRSYRHARSVDEALGELGRCAGAQFDPVMVDALQKAVAKHGWVRAEPQLAPDPSAAWSQYDHDDPTTQIPVIRTGRTGVGTDLRHARHAVRPATKPRDHR
jgi:hypothetical protein